MESSTAARMLPKVRADFIEDRLERPIEVVYRDEHFVAVFKPSGLMVHRGPRSMPGEPFLLQALRDQLDTFLYPVHRLDRPTAGLVIFGLTSNAASELGKLFQGRQVSKYYQALVRGFTEEEFIVNRPLEDQVDQWLTSGSAKVGDVASDEASRSQSAITWFRSLDRFEVNWPTPEFPTSRFTLLEVQPITGRWHQIRRHLNHVAHPVIGDHRHGDHRWNQRFYLQTGIYRMLLTSMRLDFRHPFTQELISLWVPRGESFEEAVRHLKQLSIVQ